MGNRIKVYEPKINNENQWPQKYTRKFLEQGLVDYRDIKDESGKPLGTLLLRKETIDQLLPSFIGKPVIIRHFDVDPSNFTDHAVGYITDIYFNSIDGWYYVDFLITHDEGHEKMSDGWGVSCSYKVHQLISGGDYHNIPYSQEIAAGTGEHLALVPNPRYEDCLMMVNDKQAVLYNEKKYLEHHKPQTEDKEMAFTIIGKQDDKKGFSIDSVLKLANGVTMKIKDLISLYNARASKAADESFEVAEDVEIELGNGKTVKLADMVALANKATDEGKEEDEKKNEEKAEGKERDESIKNCGCSGKEDGEHKESCKMYNAPKAVEFRNNKAIALANAKLKELEDENKALKEGAANLDKFVQIKNAKDKQGAEDAVLLQNGTTESGSMEAGFERAKNYFGVK